MRADFLQVSLACVRRESRASRELWFQAWVTLPRSPCHGHPATAHGEGPRAGKATGSPRPSHSSAQPQPPRPPASVPTERSRELVGSPPWQRLFRMPRWLLWLRIASLSRTVLHPTLHTFYSYQSVLPLPLPPSLSLPPFPYHEGLSPVPGRTVPTRHSSPSGTGRCPPAYFPAESITQRQWGHREGTDLGPAALHLAFPPETPPRSRGSRGAA